MEQIVFYCLLNQSYVSKARAQLCFVSALDQLLKSSSNTKHKAPFEFEFDFGLDFDFKFIPAPVPPVSPPTHQKTYIPASLHLLP
jgi:hypothetical protein